MKEDKTIPVSIDSLNLTIGKRTLQLSMDEARRLHSALAGVFSPGYTLCGCRPATSWYTYCGTTGTSAIATVAKNTAVSDAWTNAVN